MGVQWVAFETNPGTAERKRCGKWAKGYINETLPGDKVKLRVRGSDRVYRTRTIERSRIEPYDPFKHGRKE